MKRFYKDVTVAARGGAFEVRLDGKPVRTPLKNVLALPTRALAEAVAEEWESRGENFDPAGMQMTRFANATIDRQAKHAGALAQNILKFGASDLVCYRAEEPELAERQREEWDAILDWLTERYGVTLAVTTGIKPIEQSQDTLARLGEVVAGFGGYALTALHSAATIMGSLVLALALVEGRLTAGEAFRLSCIDEAHQAAKWGKDHAAFQRAERLAEELKAAETLLRLSRA